MDAFISYASKNAAVAARIERALVADGRTVWRDRSRIKLGVLLRTQLQEAIRDSRVVILLWSKAASRSRWVAAEVLTAFHLNRFIVPCALEATPFPQFLAATVHLDIRRLTHAVVDAVKRAVADAPAHANEVPPAFSSRPAELHRDTDRIIQLQAQELAHLLQRDTAAARRAHQKTDRLVRRGEKRWKFDSLMLNLAGYHRKNAYMIKHWDAIQAGRPPKDVLLSRAERFFFETLFVDPTDPSGLDGLGSVLMLEREYDAAEFFFVQAIEQGRRRGFEYSAAIENLQRVREASAGRRQPASRDAAARAQNAERV